MRKLAAIPLCLGLLAASPATAQTLFGADGAGGNPSNLYSLNPATGAVLTTIGAIGFSVTGLAVHPSTGVLYGSTGRETSSGNLISINKTTGAGTLIGPFNAGGQTMADLTFTSDGTLYGWLEPSTDDLHTINLTTGAATLVGNAGLSTYGAGLAANSSNTLFFAGTGNDSALRTINRTTGAPTTVATLTGGPGDAGESVSALAFNSSGTLYGAFLDTSSGGADPRFRSYLVTINTTTGAVTNLGQTVDRLDAIEFEGGVPVEVPTLDGRGLALLAVLLAGAALFVIHRIRF